MSRLPGEVVGHEVWPSRSDDVSFGVVSASGSSVPTL